MEPLVSVLVPVYGVEKYIERCARSIFEQTYQNLEIIFVNDCTPDSSIVILNRVLEDYPERKAQTRIINHDKNRGLAAARKTALLASSGYYIQNYDSDDYVDTDMIRQMVNAAQKYDADITICDLYYVYSVTDNKRYVSVNPSLVPINCLIQLLKGQVHSSLCNKLIKHSLYSDNVIMPTEGINMLEDMSVMYRLMYFAKKISYVPMALYNYTQINSNSYTTVLSKKSRQNVLDLIQLMECFFAKNLNNINNENILSAFDCFKLTSKVMLIVSANSYIERSSYVHLFPEIDYRQFRRELLFSNYVVLQISQLGVFPATVVSLMKRFIRPLRQKLRSL